MDKQTASFIDKFQTFEKLVKQMAHSGDKANFKDSLKKVVQQNSFVKKNFSLIEDLIALRNVFSHRKRGKFVANVNTYALEKLDALVEELKNPPTVISRFKAKVYEAKNTDFISFVIAEMRAKTYTHVPVWEDGKLIGVFSYTSFFEWLADRQSKTIANEKILFIKKLMGHINRKYLNPPSVNFRFISEGTNLYEIPPIFEKATKKQERLDCLFITQNGKRGEKIEGIITSWDLGSI